MSNFCRHCGSPSWRNGPCWWHEQRAAEMIGQDEDQIAAFWKSGWDAPCQGDHYDASMRELARDRTLGWMIFGVLPACAAIFLIWLFS